MDWFIFSITATTLFGVSSALYKLPSVKHQSKAGTLFWMQIFSFIFAAIVFKDYFSSINGLTLFYGLLWGSSFALLTFFQMYALTHIETNVVFPTTTTLSLVIAVLLGYLLFQESITAMQLIGIILALSSVYLFIYKKGKVVYSSALLGIGGAIVLFSVFNKIIQKFAADAVSIEALQIAQYAFAVFLSIGLVYYQRKKENPITAIKDSFRSGLFISIPAFLGGWAILTALTKGPFVLITTIHSTYIFITAIIGYLIFKEELTKRKLVLLTLAVLAVIVIRVGS